MSHVSKDMEEKEYSWIATGNSSFTAPMEISVEVPQRVLNWCYSGSSYTILIHVTQRLLISTIETVSQQCS